eukprot:gene10950-13904_t
MPRNYSSLSVIQVTLSHAPSSPLSLTIAQSFYHKFKNSTQPFQSLCHFTPQLDFAENSVVG